jgi:hypothetical protein
LRRFDIDHHREPERIDVDRLRRSPPGREVDPGHRRTDQGAQALEETASAGDPRPGVASARIRHLAATTLAKIREADLAWIAAERAMTAATTR